MLKKVLSLFKALTTQKPEQTTSKPVEVAQVAPVAVKKKPGRKPKVAADLLPPTTTKPPVKTTAKISVKTIKTEAKPVAKPVVKTTAKTTLKKKVG